MRRTGPMLVAVVLGAILAGAGGKAAVERVGQLDPTIREASGIVRSRRHADLFWVHGDSGNPSLLFAVRRDGSLVRTYRVDAPNVDWEDIAADDRGHLYLADTGNNKLNLPVRTIYRLDEPDPTAPGPPAAGPATLLRVNLAVSYKFPNGRRFDAEGLFVVGDRAIVVTKRTDGGEAELMAVPLDPAATLLRPALPTRLGMLPGCVEPATGADLSGDGRRLAVVTRDAARVFEPTEPNGWRAVATVRYRANDVEGVGWDGHDLILVGEDRSVYRIARDAWEPRPGR